MRRTTPHAQTSPKVFETPEAEFGALLRTMDGAQFDRFLDLIWTIHAGPVQAPPEAPDSDAADQSIPTLFTRWQALRRWLEANADESDDLVQPVWQRAEALLEQIVTTPCQTLTDLAAKLCTATGFGLWQMDIRIIHEASLIIGVTEFPHPGLLEPETGRNGL